MRSRTGQAPTSRTVISARDTKVATRRTPTCADMWGFSLLAAAHRSADDCRELERLCRLSAFNSRVHRCYVSFAAATFSTWMSLVGRARPPGRRRRETGLRSAAALCAWMPPARYSAAVRIVTAVVSDRPKPAVAPASPKWPSAWLTYPSLARRNMAPTQ
jgi:hypothetical protein